MALLVAGAAANLASAWPEQPLSKSSTVRMHARVLGEEEGMSTSLFHIILWSSIMIVLAVYIGTAALFNMDVGNDSLLYSKAKAD